MYHVCELVSMVEILYNEYRTATLRPTGGWQHDIAGRETRLWVCRIKPRISLGLSDA